MEADILRLILFLVGAAVIFGIYAADRYKRGVQDEPSRDWINQLNDQDENTTRSDPIEPRWDEIYKPDAEPEEEYLAEQDQEEEYQEEFDQEEDNQEEEDQVGVDTQVLNYTEAETEETVPDPVEQSISSELEQLEEIIHEDPRYDPGYSPEADQDMPKEQMSISFFNREAPKESPRENAPDLPTKIIQLTIVPHEGQFYGDDIQSVVYEVGLEPGDMNIFHHYGDDPEKQQVVYSMVSMVEPGTFPLDDMDGFSTPGITLYSQLPGPKDGLSIFSDMLHGAEQLANLLDGELRDETHSAITKQTVSHMREDIQEYHRQLQLARSKR
jgi:cell division protein ZipA